MHYGRDYVQLTRKSNDLKARSEMVNSNTRDNDADPENNPGFTPVSWGAVQVAINDIAEGWLTGKKLSVKEYFPYSDIAAHSVSLKIRPDSI